MDDRNNKPLKRVLHLSLFYRDPLGLGHIIDRIMSALAAKATVLDATEGNVWFTLDSGRINVDHAGIQSFSKLHCLFKIVGDDSR